MSSGAKAFLVIAGVLVLLVIVGALIPDPADKAAGKAPADQREFIEIVQDTQNDANDANEIEIVRLRQERGEDLCAALPDDLEVSDWFGAVEEVETTMGGDGGVLTLALGDDISVGTWNNGLSDVGSGTLIDPNSDAYGELADLEEDDVVKFSGGFVSDGDNCLEEQSLMDSNGVETPTFSFKFSAIGKD